MSNEAVRTDATTDATADAPVMNISAIVVGCGRMGRLHARVYSQIPGVTLVAVVDADQETAESVAGDYGAKAYVSVEEMLKAEMPMTDVVVATVAVPTTAHLAAAGALMRAGVCVLVEKPLAANSADCAELVAIAKETGLTTMVGHIERFNPAVRALTQLGNETGEGLGEGLGDSSGISPGFIEVTRISPLTFRSIDVGVVLDMMIHDIDIVLQLAKSEVMRVEATGVRVLSEAAEDVANARITFANGCVANLTASRLAMKTERKLRVFSDSAYVSLDYQKKYGICIRKGKNLQAIRDVVDKIRTGEIDDISQVNYADLIEIQELNIDDTEPLRAELDAFVAAAREKRASPVPFEDGLRAVEIAEQIVAAIPTKLV